MPIVYNQTTDLGFCLETIAPGALDKTDLRDVRFLVGHNAGGIPLARSRNNNENSTMQLMPGSEGLNIRVNLDTENNPEAASLYSAVERGDISGMSFSFVVDRDEWAGLDTEKPVRTIRAIKRVYEVSAVAFPAYEGTTLEARQNADAPEGARASLDSALAAYKRESAIQRLQKRRGII